MTEAQRNFLVGLFMVGGLGALGFLMVMFAETPAWLGGAEYDLKIQVMEISGVDDGAPVFLNGIKVGRVESLRFIDQDLPDKGIEVIARIKKEFRIPLGASAACIGPALGIGRGRIEITASGGGPTIKEGGVILGTMGSPFGDMIPKTMMSSVEGTVRKIGNFAEELTPVANDLHHILKMVPISALEAPGAAEKGVTANLFTTIELLYRTLKHVDDVIGDPEIKSGLREGIENLIVLSADGRAAFADLRDTSANLKIDASRVADKLEGTIDTVEGRVNELADAAAPLLHDAARTSANLRTISANLLEGKGTIGRLLTDERLYEIMVLSMERVVDMIDSIRRLMYRFEKQGAVGIKAEKAVGPFPVEQRIPLSK